MAKRGKKKAPPYDIIVGRHSVLAALESTVRVVRSVMIDREARGAIIDDIRYTGQDQGILVNVVGGEDIKRLGVGVAAQGVAAYADKLPFPDWNDIVERAEAGMPVIVLDHIEDPHNLGAIIRSAAAFCAAGVVIAVDRAAGISTAVTKTAAGGVEFVPILKVTNIAKAAQKLKSAGLWIIALEADGDSTLGVLPFSVPTALIIGNEATGVGRTAIKMCDAVLSIPLAEEVPSLNASVVAAAALYEFRRQHPIIEDVTI
jgi:23S rRNA (guanosine2251-2'-O)-methyltransferase